MIDRKNVKKSSKRIGFSNTIENTKLEGVWDRVMTYGRKVKDGITYNFDDDVFDEIIRNFANSKRDKIGSDYEHQTMNATFNGKPAPNLAYYNAYAKIKNGKVIGFYSKDSSVNPPLDNTREDGLYAYRAKVTDLGKQLIPNYNEISPLFDAEDTNEKGEVIGFNINNISFVNVSHQEGTTVGFKKGQTMHDKELYGMLGYKGDMEPSQDELKEHMKAFMTDKGFMEPKADKMLKKSKMNDMNEEEREREAEHMLDEAREKLDPLHYPEMKKMKKSGMAGIGSMEEIEGSGRGKDDLVDSVEDDEEEIKDLDKEQKKVMTKMSKQLAEANRKIAALQASETKRTQEDVHSKAVAFAKRAVAEGRWPADGMKNLIGLAKIGRGEDAISAISVGTFAPVGLSKKFYGGEPMGTDYTHSELEQVTAGGLRKSGVALSKAMKDYAKANKIEFSHQSYRMIAEKVQEEHPELFSRYAGDVGI